MMTIPNHCFPRTFIRATCIVGLLFGSQASSLLAGEFEQLNAALASIRSETLKHHTLFLASDTLEGREAGSTGGRAAGAYILNILKESGLKPRGDDQFFIQEFGDDYRNLLAYLPGSDPRLKDEFIIVGAHYDHVGFGNAQNSFGPYGHIHNGADDNASGVSGLLEVMEALTLQPLNLKRSVMIAFWDAEEKGLLGSEHWVDEPTVPLSSVRLYLNTDMIGRLRNNRLTLYGTRTGSGFRMWSSEQNRASNLHLLFDWSIKRDSDHYPFYEKQIPFLMVHTGLHDDYHRPSDDPEKLDWQGIQQVSRLMFQIVYSAAQAESLPAFRKQASSESSLGDADEERRVPAPPPRLGISWDRDLEAEGIIEIVQVMPDSPAARAGLRPGDRVLTIGRTTIDANTSFARCVNRARNPVEFSILRPNETEPRVVRATLNGEPLRFGAAWHVDAAEPGVVELIRIDHASPAEVAGLKAGDRVTHVAGELLKGSDHFRDVIATSSSPLEMIRERDGILETISVTFDDEADASEGSDDTEGDDSAEREKK